MKMASGFKPFWRKSVSQAPAHRQLEPKEGLVKRLLSVEVFKQLSIFSEAWNGRSTKEAP
jgi:hypothetical protein